MSDTKEPTFTSSDFQNIQRQIKNKKESSPDIGKNRKGKRKRRILQPTDADRAAACTAGTTDLCETFKKHDENVISRDKRDVPTLLTTIKHVNRHGRCDVTHYHCHKVSNKHFLA